jgi:sphingomyelin phosphodiesterase acid-like 3
MRFRQPDAKFITVSGDLIAHAFSCRYKSMFPTSTQDEYQEFVIKTITFVVEQLRASFPGVPVYIALGNNDSACGDYLLDAGSSFLTRIAGVIASGLPPSAQKQASVEFAAGGYYSVTMAAPMRDTRLIVVNDLFQSPRYGTCAGLPDPTAATAQMKWLREQLVEAQQQKQRVWVMGHIPPGVDPYATVYRSKDVCGGEEPVMFLSSDDLASLLVEYADVVRLGIFAHTHMDEMRLLEPEASGPRGSPERSVVIKQVPSISPVDGNNPSFIIGRVNPSAAMLEDYEVIASSNQSGTGIWASEYDYAQAYHEKDFSPSALQQLISELKDDPSGQTAVSQQYIRNYFVGGLVPELKPFWPQYVCSLANRTAKEFSACICTAAK